MPSRKQEKVGFLDNMQYEMVDENLITAVQRDELIEKLEELCRGVYVKKGQTSLDDLSVNIQRMIMSFLQKNSVDTKKNTDVLKALNNLTTHIKSLPTLTIEMAFEPTVAQLTKFAGKIELFGTRPLIMTKVNPVMLAGAVLELNGKQLDYSINNTNV